VTPSKITTEKAFENAVTVDMAFGAPNTSLHLPALAEAGITLFKAFNKISGKTPHLCNMSPGGPHHIQTLHQAGGIPALMKELSRGGLIHEDPLTVTGKSIGDNLRGKKILNPEVIRPLEKPYHPTGGLAVLFGNLAPEGAVVKQSAVDEVMLRHQGPARVFDSEEEAIKVILDRKIKKGEVIVIRYEGPKGGPGMREMLGPMPIVSVGKTGMSLLTDGRFFRRSQGAAIGLSPEAAEGSIAAVRVAIRLKSIFRKLNLLVSNEGWKKIISVKP
jgi:dihydroxy-acid dehydratase